MMRRASLGSRISRGFVSVLLASALLPVAPQAAFAVDGRITQAAIYAKANSYASGAYGGQCKVWVQTVFNAVAKAAGSSMRIGSGYHDCYKLAGGVEVTASAARRGDVIQVFESSAPNTYYSGMHTAIIVDNLGSGAFNVIDSNWALNSKVSRHKWDVAAWMRKYSAREVHYWRMGSMPISLTAPTPANLCVVPGVTYRPATVLKPGHHAVGTYPVQLQFDKSVGGVWVRQFYKNAIVTAHSTTQDSCYAPVTFAVAQTGSWRVRAYHPYCSTGAAGYSSWSYFTVALY